VADIHKWYASITASGRCLIWWVPAERFADMLQRHRLMEKVLPVVRGVAFTRSQDLCPHPWLHELFYQVKVEWHLMQELTNVRRQSLTILAPTPSTTGGDGGDGLSVSPGASMDGKRGTSVIVVLLLNSVVSKDLAHVAQQEEAGIMVCALRCRKQIMRRYFRVVLPPLWAHVK